MRAWRLSVEREKFSSSFLFLHPMSLACSKYGTCSKCQQRATDLENPDPGAPQTLSWMLSIIRDGEKNSSTENKFHDHCMSHKVAAIHRPFWEGFLPTNVSLSLTPDILHQLYLGTTDNYNTEMFEHLHIDFMKEGWWVSNQCEEFPQTITWLGRQQKISSNAIPLLSLVMYHPLQHTWHG